MYSIVLQGPLSKFSVDVINDAMKYTLDVIVVTWNNSLSKEIEKTYTGKVGVKFILIEDPNSKIAYIECGVKKYLNIARRKISYLKAMEQVLNEHVIISRVDASIDYNFFYNRWLMSVKKVAIINVTSVCPNRLFGDKIYCCMSDWAFASKKSTFVDAFNILPPETVLATKAPFIMNNAEWHSILCPEQIFTLSFLGVDLENENLSNENLYDKAMVSYHSQAKSIFCNVNKKAVKLKSNKYRGGRSTSWKMYSTEDFSDDGMIKFNIKDILFFVIGNVYRRIKSFSFFIIGH